MNLKETYNHIAEEWHQDHQTDDWWVRGTDKFISFLKSGSLVLDAGCGGGTKSKYLISKGLRVVGVDFSESMIAIARREVPGGTFHVLDLNDVETLEESFDGVFTQAVLLHVPKHRVGEVIKKMVTKLKQGGYLYIAVKEKKSDGPDEEVKTEDDYGYPYERFFSYFTADEIKSYVEDVGLRVVFSEITPSGNVKWIQIIARK